MGYSRVALAPRFAGRHLPHRGCLSPPVTRRWVRAVGPVELVLGPHRLLETVARNVGRHVHRRRSPKAFNEQIIFCGVEQWELVSLIS